MEKQGIYSSEPVETVEFCRHCGYELPKEAIVCVLCGSPVRSFTETDHNIKADVGLSERADVLKDKRCARWRKIFLKK